MRGVGSFRVTGPVSTPPAPPSTLPHRDSRLPMSNRTDALLTISTAPPASRPAQRTTEAAASNLPETFGQFVFGEQAQRRRLPKPVFESLRRTIESGQALDPSIADAVATGMKDWAIELGATHYMHWFQPMTGLTAEKHDSFLQPSSGGRAILEFSGDQLVQGEPDASSFPSGGLRATFEARGYTAWDPTSPAFLRKTADGATLTIPTVFCSWTGEALDKKTPLLRSCEAVSNAAVRLLKLLGEEAERVSPNAGVEQEYFLIDRSFAMLRPDLVATGRTVIGAAPLKGQEFDDHYFGTIGPRTLRFMMDLEQELWALGIPIKTRHNEVAPSQFELAPVYSGVSVAADQNLLTMSVLQDVASRHGLTALLHEKPFAGLNGSGKHLNWSLADDRGNNMLDPGNTPGENLKFMLFLTAIVRGVDRHQDLLRAAIASAGNDHRLGANEAPPAIISIFVGSQLEEVVDALAAGRAPSNGSVGEPLRLGVSSLPELPRDISDRNRTSPFAFTGNKFEFRAVSSNQSIAYPAAFLNLIVAESLDHLSDALTARGGASPENVQAVVSETLKAHRRILFGGDNYSDEWHAEAKKRGLLNRRSTPEALVGLDAPSNIELFEKYKVLAPSELASRLHVMTETYAGKINVEANATRELARTVVMPSALRFQDDLARATERTTSLIGEEAATAQLDLLRRLTAALSTLETATEALETERAAAHGSSDGDLEEARRFRERVVPAMDAVRDVCDQLEGIIDDQRWPLPKYREMLFIH